MNTEQQTDQDWGWEVYIPSAPGDTRETDEQDTGACDPTHNTTGSGEERQTDLTLTVIHHIPI